MKFGQPGNLASRQQITLPSGHSRDPREAATPQQKEKRPQSLDNAGVDRFSAPRGPQNTIAPRLQPAACQPAISVSNSKKRPVSNQPNVSPFNQSLLAVLKPLYFLYELAGGLLSVGGSILYMKENQEGEQ